MKYKLIAYYSVYNEADYLEYSLRSIYDHVDEIIIIEGAFGETLKHDGTARSTDGTIEIIEDFPDQDNKITLLKYNEPCQLDQRNVIWEYFEDRGFENFWLLLVDGDECFKEEDLDKIKILVKQDPAKVYPKCYYFDSLTFINDFWTYAGIAFPRLFPICHYDNKFVAPNDIVSGEIKLQPELTSINFFHYSFCKSPKRFKSKKTERTQLHGQFKWMQDQDDYIYSPGLVPKKFTSEHPEVMKSHPKYSFRHSGKITRRKNTVLVEHSGIGNIILLTPTIRAVRELRPKDNLFVVSWPRASRIIEGMDEIDMVVSHKYGEFFSSLHLPIDDLFISPVGSLIHPDQLKQVCNNIWTFQIKVPWIEHEAEIKFKLARSMGYSKPMPAPKVHLFQHNIDEAAEIIRKYRLGKFIIVNIGYLKSEHWHLKHAGNKTYVELIKKLAKNYPYDIVLFGSKDDNHDAEFILNSANLYGKAYNLCGQFSDIKSSAAFISFAKALIGNDGGLAHIAAALQVPTVTIFTFTNHIKNQPLGGRNLNAMIDCNERPMCQHGNYNQCKCLNVPMETVWKQVEECLS